jgi:hypothetical protein
MDDFEQLNTPDNLIKRIEALENSLRALQMRDVSADTLSEMADDAGVIRGGAFICGEGDPLADDGEFTGVALLDPGIEYPSGSGITYEFIGMNAGVVEVGIDNLGQLFAGGGDVLMNSDGVTLDLSTTPSNTTHQVKWSDGTNIPVNIGASYSGGYVIADVDAKAVASGDIVSVNISATNTGATNPASVEVISNDVGSYIFLSAQHTQSFDFRVAGALEVDNSLTVAGNNVIDTSDLASTTAKGIASFDSGDFTVTSGVVTLKNAFSGAVSFTPTIIGTTTAGVGTYTSQGGYYYAIGKLVFIQIVLTWTAHTGTGNMRVSNLPFTLRNTSINVPFTVSWSNITLLAIGNKLLAVGIQNSNTIAIQEIGSAASSFVPMDTAGTLVIAGCYLAA